MQRSGWIPWVRGAVLGAILGLLFLGIGGRVAMRAIAMREGAATGFSLGGSLTVIMLGAASGLAAGVIYAASRVILGRHPAWARVAFGIVLMAITLRGLNPVDGARLILFLPLFIVFAILLDRLWERQTNRAEAIH